MILLFLNLSGGLYYHGLRAIRSGAFESNLLSVEVDCPVLDGGAKDGEDAELLQRAAAAVASAAGAAAAGAVGRFKGKLVRLAEAPAAPGSAHERVVPDRWNEAKAERDLLRGRLTNEGWPRVCRDLYTCAENTLADALCPEKVWSAKCIHWPNVTCAHAPRQVEGAGLFELVSTLNHRRDLYKGRAVIKSHRFSFVWRWVRKIAVHNERWPSCRRGTAAAGQTAR
jgi:hypothetical protein